MNKKRKMHSLLKREDIFLLFMSVPLTLVYTICRGINHGGLAGTWIPGMIFYLLLKIARCDLLTFRIPKRETAMLFFAGLLCRMIYAPGEAAVISDFLPVFFLCLFLLLLTVLMETVSGKRLLGGGDIRLLLCWGTLGDLGGMISVLMATLFYLILWTGDRRYKTEGRVPLGPGIVMGMILVLVFQ